MSITCRGTIRYVRGKFDSRSCELNRTREPATAPEALPYELRSEQVAGDVIFAALMLSSFGKFFSR